MTTTDTLSDIALHQRGRASVDFFAHIFRGSAAVRQRAEEEVTAAGVVAEHLPDDLDERQDYAESRARTSQAFRIQQLLGEWHSQQHGPTAVAAFEELGPVLIDRLEQLDSGPTELVLDEQFEAPTFWQGVDFHRTRGGWDGHPFMGFVHGEIVHRKMVDALFPGGIFKQRLAVAATAPKTQYAKILELGCSTGHYTLALSETYPTAEITGVDLSQRTLEHARRVANERGYAWQLMQRCATNTDLLTESFDLVTSYILLHELPSESVQAVFDEAFRLLQPGGDLLMSDVTRYADLDKLAVWKADRGARYGGEPHWRASASLDLAKVAQNAGFIDVSAGGLNGAPYPYLVSGRKPDE